MKFPRLTPIEWAIIACIVAILATVTIGATCAVHRDGRCLDLCKREGYVAGAVSRRGACECISARPGPPVYMALPDD